VTAIVPTVGRIVYFYEFPNGVSDPEAAIVTSVTKHGDYYSLGLVVFKITGRVEPKFRVCLFQPSQPDPLTGPLCRWMPYQVKKVTGSESGEKAAGTENI